MRLIVWWGPADYRARADWYKKRAETAPSLKRSLRYNELAGLYLETAKRLEAAMAVRAVHAVGKELNSGERRRLRRLSAWFRIPV